MKTKRAQVAITAVLLYGLARGALAISVVYPTGDPALDVAAVRAAVSSGGTVLLKANDAFGNPQWFDFGDYPVAAIDWDFFGSGYVALGTNGKIVRKTVDTNTVYVSLGNDVRLLGETKHGSMTTIRGGTIPIRNFEFKDVPGAGQQIVWGFANLEVDGVRFVESALQSIYLTHLGSSPDVQSWGLQPRIEIKRNEFVDVQPAFAGGTWYSLAVVTDGPAGPVRYQDNRVHFAPDRWGTEQRDYEVANGLDPSYELWEGLSIADLNAAGYIGGNKLSGIDIGVLVYFGGKDFVHIVNNTLDLRPKNGVAGIICQANHRYLVERNTVIANGTYADGIYFYGTDQSIGINGSTARGNHIVLNESEYGGISLFGTGSFNSFVNNRVEGSATYALALSYLSSPDNIATLNVFSKNELRDFVPRVSNTHGFGVHVLFDENTRKNLFLGYHGTVLDLGDSNVFTKGSQ